MSINIYFSSLKSNPGKWLNGPKQHFFFHLRLTSTRCDPPIGIDYENFRCGGLKGVQYMY